MWVQWIVGNVGIAVQYNPRHKTHIKSLIYTRKKVPIWLDHLVCKQFKLQTIFCENKEVIEKTICKMK